MDTIQFIKREATTLTLCHKRVNSLNQMNIPYLDLTYQFQALEEKLMEITKNVLKNGQYILGPEVFQCERKLADFVGAPYCVTAGSGTDALLMTLLSLGIGSGDEIIVPAFSFFATAEVVALIGAKPIFVDIEPETYHLDSKKIENSLTKKTRGILPVSLYGQVADMGSINSIARKHDLVVIEDGAQSFGASYRNRKSCNLSPFACTSFFPAKPLGCFGDGGAVFCQNQKDYEKLVQIRNHGQESRYHHTRIGYNGRLDTLQCAILMIKLERYPWEIKRRQKIAIVYNEEFKDLEFLKIPVIKKDRNSIFAQYTLKVKKREAFQRLLTQEGIPTSIHYPKGMHQQPAMFKMAPKDSLKVTENLCHEVISLPLYADMPEDHVALVVEKVKKVVCQMKG